MAEQGKKQWFDRDPGLKNRARHAALKKAMGDTRPDGGKSCFYGHPGNKKFCTEHLKHH